ncbi:MAG: sulfatase [Cyclobacteriaceae bacterium]
MNRYQYSFNLSQLTVFICVLLFFSCGRKRPNVVIFFTDDQGYADMGCYGAEGFDTPNLDQLAGDGIRFTDFYVPATVCTPSRAGLLTGRYPKRADLHEAVLFPYSEHGLSTDEYTMAEMLQENGYSTACIGKWHLGHKQEFMPNRHGFDYYYGVPYSNDMDNHYYQRLDFQAPPLPVFINEQKIEEGPDQRYLTKRYTEEAVRLIKESKDDPFFIYLAHNMPHLPLFVSEAFEGKSELGIYGDVIMELDWSAGEIVKALKETGKYDNTIFVVTSDNGPRVGSAKPLRGKKGQTWDGGQRVPGIMVWPEEIDAGQTCSEMVTTMDLFPTLAGILDAEIPTGHLFDGMDISKLLENPASVQLPERPLYFYARNGKPEAVRMGKWKLHLDKSVGWNKKDDGAFRVSLYNLDEDIAEQQDVSGQFPDVVEKLSASIRDFDSQL